MVAHAWLDDPEAHFYPWLKNELESGGIDVNVPRLPGHELPKQEDWVGKLQKEYQRFTSTNNVVVGHSLGSWAALKLAEKQQMRKLILVGPVSPASLKKDLEEKSLTAEQLKMFEDFIGGIESNVDFEKVKNNVDSVS